MVLEREIKMMINRPKLGETPPVIARTKYDALQERCARLEKENDELEDQLSQAEINIERLEGQDRRKGWTGENLARRSGFVRRGNPDWQ